MPLPRIAVQAIRLKAAGNATSVAEKSVFLREGIGINTVARCASSDAATSSTNSASHRAVPQPQRRPYGSRRPG